MGLSQSITFVLIISVFGFLLLGSSIIEFSAPEIRQSEAPNPEDNAFVLFFKEIFGVIDATFDTLAWALGTIWTTLLAILRIATFNIPGAPIWVTAIFGSIVATTLFVSVIKLIRGTE